MSNCWYFDKIDLLHSPSRLDNIDYATEVKYRIAGARFIIETGAKMDLGYNTTATGVVYFHRFYMLQSFKNFPHYVTACCCLYLAGKVEETPKRCHEILKVAKGSLSKEDFAKFGCKPREEMMTLERILLQTIKFDLQVDHPYSFLLKYAKCLRGDKDKLEKMVQMAWTFVNDSLSTSLCLQWEPEIIAVSMMYLAGKLSRFEAVDWEGRAPGHLRWWDAFIEGITVELIEDICHQVLDLYSADQPLDKSESLYQSPNSKHSMSPDEPAFKISSRPNGELKRGITKPPPPPLPIDRVHLTLPPPPSLLLTDQMHLTTTPPPPPMDQAHLPPLLPSAIDQVHLTLPPPSSLLLTDQMHLTTTPPPPMDQAHLPPLLPSAIDQVHLEMPPQSSSIFDPFVKSNLYWCNEPISFQSFK